MSLLPVASGPPEREHILQLRRRQPGVVLSDGLAEACDTPLCALDLTDVWHRSRPEMAQQGLLVVKQAKVDAPDPPVKLLGHLIEVTLRYRVGKHDDRPLAPGEHRSPYLRVSLRLLRHRDEATAPHGSFSLNLSRALTDA